MKTYQYLRKKERIWFNVVMSTAAGILGGVGVGFAVGPEPGALIVAVSVTTDVVGPNQ